jgi:H+/Cl- antiporter ClcA
VPNTFTNSNPYLQVILSIFFGVIVGAITYLFMRGLEVMSVVHSQLNAAVPYHLVLAPFILAFFILIRRNTLYFPSKVSELHDEVSSHYWSWIMFPIHFIGPLLSHAAGMSVGREGAVVMYAAGLVRTFKLSWSFWGPVLASIGFSCALNNYWLTPVFMLEMFPHTNSVQKLCAFIGAIAAVITAQQLGMPPLFLPFEINDSLGFFAKFGVFTLFALGSGYIMRLYKKAHVVIETQVKKSSVLLPLGLAVFVAGLLYIPEFRPYQSIVDISDLQSPHFTFLGCFAKLAFTVLCTSLGFLGGDFYPVVFAGVNWGGALFGLFGAGTALGAAFGAFILFAAGTRLKWTSFIMMSFLLGWSWMLWIFFVLTIAINFAGEHSLYHKRRH